MFVDGAFYNQAFDNTAGTGGFYTGVESGAVAESSYPAGRGYNDITGRTTRKRRLEDEALSKVIRKVLGIVSPEDQAEALAAAQAEAARIALLQSAEREAWLARNADDEQAILALAALDDEVIAGVVGVVAQVMARHLKARLH